VNCSPILAGLTAGSKTWRFAGPSYSSAHYHPGRVQPLLDCRYILGASEVMRELEKKKEDPMIEKTEWFLK